MRAGAFITSLPSDRFNTILHQKRPEVTIRFASASIQSQNSTVPTSTFPPTKSTHVHTPIYRGRPDTQLSSLQTTAKEKRKRFWNPTSLPSLLQEPHPDRMACTQNDLAAETGHLFLAVLSVRKKKKENENCHQRPRRPSVGVSAFIRSQMQPNVIRSCRFARSEFSRLNKNRYPRPKQAFLLGSTLTLHA